MRYFRINFGFNDSDFIGIDETELEKALYAHTVGAVGVFKNGSVSGKNIIAIKEDWHKAMGWNYGYTLLPEDYNIIDRKCKNYVGVIAEAKDRVQQYIKSGQIDKIGKTSTEKVSYTESPKMLEEPEPTPEEQKRIDVLKVEIGDTISRLKVS